MPRLSSFYGIDIYIYAHDHNPPHFHAMTGGREATIQIRDGQVLHGRLSRPDERRVATWHRLHLAELMTAWKKAAQGADPGSIEPLA